jgi:hypothetical protein
LRARGFEWGAIFDRARGFFVGGREVLWQGEAGLQRERVYRNARMEQQTAPVWSIYIGNIPLMKQKRCTEWKRNSSQDGKGWMRKDPRMEQQTAPPHETEKAHRMEGVRRQEWKGRGLPDRRGKMHRIEEDRRHGWKRDGAPERGGKGPRCKRKMSQMEEERRHGRKKWHREWEGRGLPDRRGKTPGLKGACGTDGRGRMLRNEEPRCKRKGAQMEEKRHHVRKKWRPGNKRKVDGRWK